VDAFFGAAGNEWVNDVADECHAHWISYRSR
jgi:hypothetical protein